MRYKLEFRHRAGSPAYFRMTLDDDWPPSWTVPYADLLAADLIKYFEVPPLDPEGVSDGVNYQMDVVTYENADFADFQSQLKTLIDNIKPPEPSEPGVEYVLVSDG